MPDRPDHFRCPVCKSVSCERVIVKRPQGTPYVTSLYACTTCTIVFLDPIAFTRGYEERPTTIGRRSRGSSYAAWSRINQARKDRNE